MRNFAGSSLLRFLIFSTCLAWHLAGQAIELRNPAMTETGGFHFTFSTRGEAYYRIFSSTNVPPLGELSGTPDVLLLGPGERTLNFQVPSVGNSFFQVQELPLEMTLDSDGDGIDDVWELRHPGLLNPLLAADATTDPDGDGQTLLQDYERAMKQEFSLVIGNSVTGGVPAAGAGMIETSRSQDIYTFNASPGQTVFLRVDGHDEAAGSAIWELRDQDGLLLFRKPLKSGHPGRLVLARGGSYRLTVNADPAQFGVGGYGFTLLPVISQEFYTVISTLVTNKVPKIGAGNIETPGAQDIYTFDAPAGQEIFVVVTSYVNEPGWPLRDMDWQLRDEGGELLFNRKFAEVPASRLVLARGGRYTLTVNSGSQHVGVGTYGFRILTIPSPQEFLVTIGASVPGDLSDPGAGTLERAGAEDIYTFEANPGQVVYIKMDRYSSSADSVSWQLKDADDALLFDRFFRDGDPGRLVLKRGGRYTLTVNSAALNLGTGTYSFSLLPVAPPQEFELAIGATVTNGVPGPGAGVIETPGAQDIFYFNATPGQEVVFPFHDATGSMNTLIWEFRDETGTLVYEHRASTGYAGQLRLERGGRYSLTVNTQAKFTQTGTYSFSLLQAPPPQVFSLALGDSVTNGFPAKGAGVLEVAGARDVYVFEAKAGQEVLFYLHDLFEREGSIGWRVVDQDGAAVASRLSNTFGQFILERGGRYTLTMEGSDPNHSARGTYAFSLLPVAPPQEFHLAMGDSVTNGVPATGAGNIENWGVRDVYTFDATPGQVVFFRLDGFDEAAGYIFWELRDEDGTRLFLQKFYDGHPGRFTLARGGRYTVTVNIYGYSQLTGTYAFSLLPSTSPQNFPLAIGGSVTNGVPSPGAGVIETIGGQDIYTFELTSSQGFIVQIDGFAGPLGELTWEVWFEDLWAAYHSEFRHGTSGPVRLGAAGRYHLMINTDPHFAGVGPYALRLLPAP